MASLSECKTQKSSWLSKRPIEWGRCGGDGDTVDDDADVVEASFRSMSMHASIM